MEHIPDHARQPERPRSLEELRCRLKRRVSDLREGWTRCDNRSCRRWKQCCGEGPVFKCTDDGRPRLTLSEEEKAKIKSDLYKAVKRRCAEFAAGVKPPDEDTPRKLRDAARTAERRRLKSAQAGVTTPATDSPQADGAEPPAPVAEETQLSPEKQERINRAWNDTIASLPAEEADERKRERRSRITQL
jgi:hypothetical protein